MGIFLGVNFPSWNYRVGIIGVAIFRVGVFMLPRGRGGVTNHVYVGRNDVYVRQKRLFFAIEINFCRYERSFFYLKLFLQTEVSQNGFNLHKIES